MNFGNIDTLDCIFPTFVYLSPAIDIIKHITTSIPGAGVFPWLNNLKTCKMNMDIKEFTEKFANQFIDDDVKNLKETTVFRELGTWDSLTGMAVLTMIEDDYGVTIPVDDFLQLKTPTEVFKYVKNKKQ